MKLRDQGFWNEGQRNNANSTYGSAVYRFAESWAGKMESAMAAGSELADVALPTSQEVAIHHSISQAQYQLACGILYKVWAHGDELRTCIK